MNDAPTFAKCVGPGGRVVEPGRRWYRADSPGPDGDGLGRRIALHGSPARLAGWLTAFDGCAAALLFVPADACAALRERIVTVGGADRVIVDDPNRAAFWAGAGIEVIVDGQNSDALAPAQARDAGQSDPTCWVLSTSGTTATPKLVAHTLASLTATIHRDTRFTDYRWALLYDPARMAGLQVLLQALVGESTLLAPDRQAPLREQVAWLAGEGCSAVSATPTQWRRLLMADAGRALMLRQVSLGGEIADAGTLAALRAAWPKARLTHVYASTEAGVGFAVHDGRPGFPAAWLEAGGHGGVRMAVGTEGTLRLARDASPQTYLGDAPALVDDGWIDTGDLVEIGGDRVLFRGRANGAINVGGSKVVPEEVEAVIRECDGVDAALVRARASSVMGALVEALVQPRPDGAPDPKAIRAHCRARLAAWKVPARVRIVDALPVSSTGKLQRMPA